MFVAVVFTILGEAAFTRTQLPVDAKGRPGLAPTIAAAAGFAVASTCDLSKAYSTECMITHVLKVLFVLGTTMVIVVDAMVSACYCRQWHY